MTSKERVFAALEGRMPDRVSTMEMVVDQKVIQAIHPGVSYYDFIEEIGFDVVCVGMSTDTSKIEWINEDKKIFKGKWGETRAFTTEVKAVPIPPYPIQTEDDLKSYTPPDPNDPGALGDLREVVKRFKGKKAIAWVGGGVFAPQQYLRGVEELLMDYALNPQLVKKLAKIGEEYYIELHRRVIKEGVDIVILGDDYAGKTGPMMSPAHFESFIFPGLTAIVKEIKKADTYCIKHTDGNIWKIIDMIIKTGVDAIGPVEIGAGMELDKIKEKYDICVVGNVDIDLLSRGTVEEVIEATKECIKKGASRGGHILSSANSIISAVNPDNFLAMVNTAKEFGNYPITDDKAIDNDKKD